MWKFNVTSLPCFVLRKADNVYVWPVSGYIDEAELLAAGRAWLQRVDKGQEVPYHLAPLDVRPNPCRLAFDFTGKLYTKDMFADSHDTTEKENDEQQRNESIDDASNHKSIDIEQASNSISQHDEL